MLNHLKVSQQIPAADLRVLLLERQGRGLEHSYARSLVPRALASLFVCGLQSLALKLVFPVWLSSRELAALVFLSAWEAGAHSDAQCCLC